MPKDQSVTQTQKIDPAVRPFRDAYLKAAFGYAGQHPLQFFGFPGFSQASPFPQMGGISPGSPTGLPDSYGGRSRPRGGRNSYEALTGQNQGGQSSWERLTGRPLPGQSSTGGAPAANYSLGGGYAPSGQANFGMGGPYINPTDLPPEASGFTPYQGGMLNTSIGHQDPFNRPPLDIPGGPGPIGPGMPGQPGQPPPGGNYIDPFSTLPPGTDPYVAGIDPRTNRGFDLLERYATANSPELAKDFFNPYQQEVIGGIQSDFDRQRGILGQRVADQATAARAFGGSRQAVLEAEGLRGIGENEARTLGEFRYGGYQDAIRNAMLERQLGYQGGGLLAGAGEYTRGHRQQEIDAARQRFEQAQNFGLQGLNVMQSALTGIPMGFSQTQSGGGSSPFGQFLGAGLALAPFFIPGVGPYAGAASTANWLQNRGI